MNANSEPLVYLDTGVVVPRTDELTIANIEETMDIFRRSKNEGNYSKRSILSKDTFYVHNKLRNQIKLYPKHSNDISYVLDTAALFIENVKSITPVEFFYRQIDSRYLSMAGKNYFVDLLRWITGVDYKAYIGYSLSPGVMLNLTSIDSYNKHQIESIEKIRSEASKVSANMSWSHFIISLMEKNYLFTFLDSIYGGVDE